MLSVHSIVSMDFAVSQLPGWHTTIFPPYFVAGAIFSGFAMVLTLMVITRKAFGLENLITIRHIDNMAKIMLVTGSMVGYAYGMEFFIAWYSGNPYEAVRVPEPRVRAIRLGVLDHGVVQRHPAADLLVQEGPHEPGDAVRHVDLRQRRHVVRAVRDHRHVAAPRLPAVELGHVHADDLGRSSRSSAASACSSPCSACSSRFLPIVATAEVKGVLPEADPHHGEEHVVLDVSKSPVREATT